jgi:hypothetical protein
MGSGLAGRGDSIIEVDPPDLTVLNRYRILTSGHRQTPGTLRTPAGY